MDNDESLNQAYQQAVPAFKRGDRQAARAIALALIRVTPQREEPWLLLAALAEPRAARTYLERAMQINHGSRRAQAGLDWLDRQSASAPKSTTQAKIPRAAADERLPVISPPAPPQSIPPPPPDSLPTAASSTSPILPQPPIPAARP